MFSRFIEGFRLYTGQAVIEPVVPTRFNVIREPDIYNTSAGYKHSLTDPPLSKGRLLTCIYLIIAPGLTLNKIPLS